MREWKRSPYEAVPAKEQQSGLYPEEVSALHQYHTTGEHSTVKVEKQNEPGPQPLEAFWLYRILRLVLDLIVGSVALLFAIFGVWVYRIDGNLAGPESTGSKLFSISQYVSYPIIYLYIPPKSCTRSKSRLANIILLSKAPTIFPVVFAAIADSSMKSMASWRIQTSRGATIMLVQQCLGSQTISGAFLTQVKLRALNFFAIFIILLWCLSPLGSQASLRVISIGASYSNSPVQLATMNTFTEYQYGFAEGMTEAITDVTSPVIASLLAASLLGTRNQDLWGNIRFPVIENLENTSNGWIDVPQNNNLTYASLVGTPVSNLPNSGNTSFTLPGSYLSISCPIFGLSNQTEFTNYTNSDAPSPDNGVDCSWTSAQGGTQYQIAISQPCYASDISMASDTRSARKLVWESFMDYQSSGYEPLTLWTQAICHLTTTYVDANVTCIDSLSGSSSASTCNLSSTRRSPSPQFNSNWTVFDISGGAFDASAALQILTGLFPNAQNSGGVQPVLVYFTDPYHAVSGTTTQTYTVGPKVFETRLAQLLNSILYIGISSSDFTGSFKPGESALKLTGVNTLQQEVVRCSLPWLGVLIFASLTIFVCSLIGAFLRIITFTPNVLGSTSLALLHNRTRGIVGSSTWSSDEWARNLRDTKLYFGDVEPGAEVGRIALATSVRDVHVGVIKGRYYV